MEREIRGHEELGAFAHAFIKKLRPHKEHATVFGLRGELGSGKTTFVQTVARILGVRETVTSPTFVIEKLYMLEDGQDFDQLVHIDAYRLEDGTELTALGWKELYENPANLIFIEWPEHVHSILPEGTPTLSFTYIDDTRRNVTLHGSTEDA